MPVAKRHARRPSTVPPCPDTADRNPEQWFGHGPYAVITDYTLWHGGDLSSCVLAHCETEDEALRFAAARYERFKRHVRVERWHGQKGETVVVEFGGPSLALAESARETEIGAGGRERPGERLSEAERDRRARLILAHIAERPNTTGGTANAIGHYDSGIIGVLTWGCKAGYWQRDSVTGRLWEATPAGLEWMQREVAA